MTQLSPNGFASRFTACSRTLWCVAAAIVGDPDLAEDVLQEAALIALGKLDQFDPTTSFPAWMSQIVRYVALNHARCRSRNRARTVDPSLLNDTVATQETPRPIERDDELLAALQELGETARSCLLLKTVMDLPYREIALTLDIPEGTAMSHVFHARRTLSERLCSTTSLGVGS